MKAFIKSRSEFKTRLSLDSYEHELTLASIYDNVSHIKVIGEVEALEGDFLITDDYLGVIKQAARKNGTTDISCSTATTIFARPLMYSAPSQGTTIERFVKSEIEANYKNLSDKVYAMPYIIIANPTTETKFITPEVDDKGLYNIKSYIARVRRLSNVFVAFSITGNSLVIEIEHRLTENYNIDFSETAHELVNENFSESSVAKITAVVGRAETDYYLLADGTITTAPDLAKRASGLWKVITCRVAESVVESVSDEFAKNSHSHSVEFFSDKQIPFYSKVTLRLRERVLSSYISQVIISSGDNRRFYKSGELATSFTEKQQEVI